MKFILRSTKCKYDPDLLLNMYPGLSSLHLEKTEKIDEYSEGDKKEPCLALDIATMEDLEAVEKVIGVKFIVFDDDYVDWAYPTGVAHSIEIYDTWRE